ncbi:MAG: toxin-antitoxin system protein [Acidobacteriota bacterium]
MTKIMSTLTIRISKEAQDLLCELARQEGKSMRAVLEKALKLYEERVFWEKANRAYAALKANSKAWQQELKEREEWDATLKDGLEDE